MKFKLLSLQLIVGLIIISILFFSITWMFLHIQDPKNSFNQAMTLLVSFLGPLSTVFAALVATYLFNDWKDQQRHQNSLEFAKITLDSYKVFDRDFDDLLDELLHYLELLKISEVINDADAEDLAKKAYKNLTLYHYFHDDFVNFWYVSKSEYDIDPLLNEWTEKVHSFFNKINNLPTEDEGFTKQQIVLEELTSDSFNKIPSSFYKHISKIILKPLRLEN